MRFIIQELNNPLKYDFDEFPFLTFYSIQSKPNRDDLIKLRKRVEAGAIRFC